MARTESNMLPIGTIAPDFTLTDTVTGKIYSLSSMSKSKGTVIMFICNHCPFVKHINQELVKLAEEYIQKGIDFFAISSNDVERYPEDSPELMRTTATSLGYPFPYLYDESQNVARAYEAACTPDFFVFNSDLKLAYRGRLDESTPSNNKPINGEDLRGALSALVNKQFVSEIQYPSIGCGIKWKS